MASYLAGIAILAVLVRGIIYWFQHRPAAAEDLHIDRAEWGRYIACFLSGILLTNAIPHFFHGVSGEVFPAPFGKALGGGLPQNLSNVVWGFINLVVGYHQFVTGKVASSSLLGKVVFFAGILLMGIFLAAVFSH